MNRRINVLKGTAVFVLFMFVSTFVPVEAAKAAEHYNETVTYNNRTVGHIASGDVTLASGDTITTTSVKGYGVHVSGASGHADIDSVDIKTQYDSLSIADGAHGVYVHNGASADITGGTRITTTGTRGYGVYTDISSIANLTDTTVLVSGDAAHGVYGKNGSSVTVTNGTIATSGSGSGVRVEVNHSKAIVSGDAIITTSGTDSYGVYANIDSSAEVNTATIKTSGIRGHGVYATIKSYLSVTGGSIETSGPSAYGVYASASSADVRNATIITRGVGGYGVISDAASSVDVTQANINTKNNNSYGVYSNNGSSMDVKDSLIRTEGTNAHGTHAAKDSYMKVANSVITTSGTGANGIYAYIRSKLNASGDVIITEGPNANGVAAAGKSDVEVVGGSIKTNGTNANALYAAEDSNITVDGTDMLVMGNASSFNLGPGTNSITVTGVTPENPNGRLLQSSNNGVFTNTLTAKKSVLSGDITHITGFGTMDINLEEKTKLTAGVNSLYSGAKINMNIDKTSTWNVTKNSAMYGRLNNAGTMDFGSSVSDGAKKVKVSDYNGTAGSKLFMKTDINTAAEMDQILASNTATGTSNITIFNTANAGVEKSAPLLRGANGGGSELVLQNWDEEENGVKYHHAGAWRYSLVKETTASGAEEWVLKRGDKIPPKPDPDPDPDDPEPLRPIGLTTTGQAIVAAAFLHDVWYTETNTWNSRMGIYRDNLWNGGLWFTGVANREDFDHEHDNTVADRQDFTTGTIGFDKKYEMKNGDFWGGVMVGYGKADSDLLAGIGDVDMDSYHMSLYGVYRNNNGFYVNGILKYNDYRSELNVYRTDEFSKRLGFNEIHGEWSQDGLGISLQAGKRFDFAGGDGWYWEPQAQFSWNRVFASGYRTDSGIDVEVDDIDYIRLRGGVVLGRSWTLKNGTLLDLYADASIIHDFDADVDVTMSGGTYTSTLGGTWGIYGIGANWQFKPGQFLHARFQYSDGEPFTEPFAVYLGLSFEM